MGGRVLSSSGTSPNITFNLDQSISVVNGDKFLYVNEDGVLVTCNISSTVTGSTIALTNASGVPVNGGVFAVVKTTLDGQLFKVIHVQETSPEEYTVIALQHDETKFAIIDAAVTFDPIPTTLYSIDKLPVVTALTVSQWWETVSGVEAFPHISVSWTKPDDGRIVGFQVQLKTPLDDYTLVYDGSMTNWDSDRLTSSNNNDYSVRVRCYDAIGRYSDWSYHSSFSILGKNTSPATPSSATLTAIINGFTAHWTNPQLADFKYTEVWVGTTSTQASSTLVAQISDDFYINNTLAVGDVRYVWLRAVTHAATNNTSSFLSLGSVTARGVVNTDLGSGFTAGIPHGSSLPGSASQGDLFFLTTDNKLYRYTGSAWTPAVAASDITGTLTDSQLAAIAAAKITGQITTTQITDNSISTAKLQAGSVTTNEIAANTITAADIAAGTITATQIAAGTITANEIAANTITGSKIVTGTITASLLSVSTLSAITADIGTVTAGTIRNSGSTYLIDVTNGKVTTKAGGYALYQGNGFGSSSDLVLWYGPDTTAIGSATKTNGKWAFATDGKVYYGTAELITGGGGFTITSNFNEADYTGDGLSSHSSPTTNTITVTPSGGSGSYTYAWTCTGVGTSGNFGFPTASTSATSAFQMSTIGIVEYEGTGTCTVTDTGTSAQRQLTFAVKFYNTP
jgi:hypothetical protein